MVEKFWLVTSFQFCFLNAGHHELLHDEFLRNMADYYKKHTIVSNCDEIHPIEPVRDLRIVYETDGISIGTAL